MKLTTQITSSTPFFYFWETVDYISKKNWLEGDSGSLSMIMDMNDIWPYVADAYNPKEYPLDIKVPELSDRFILLTADNTPLRNVAKFKFKVHRMVGIIQINFAGDGYKVVWGFADGNQPTKFLKTHLLIHNNRIRVEPKHRVLIHALPTNLVQKTYLDHLDDEAIFAYDIWNAMPAFAEWAPEGIGLLTDEQLNLLSSSEEIAQKFAQYRLVTLKYHGVISAGCDWDEVITLLESLDKAASTGLRLLKEEDYAIKPPYFEELAKTRGFMLNPAILKVGYQKKDQALVSKKPVKSSSPDLNNNEEEK